MQAGCIYQLVAACMHKMASLGITGCMLTSLPAPAVPSHTVCNEHDSELPHLVLGSSRVAAMHRLCSHHSGRRAWPLWHLHAGLQGPEVCARPTLYMLCCTPRLLLLLLLLGRLRKLLLRVLSLLRELGLRALQIPRKMARPMRLGLLLVRVGHMPGGCRVDAGCGHWGWG